MADDVDYDDRPPDLREEDYPRNPDPASIAHDREVRDDKRLEEEVRG